MHGRRTKRWEWVCERERERVCVCVCVRTVPVCMCVSGWNCYRNYESVPHTLRMFRSESEPINVAQCPPTGKLHTETTQAHGLWKFNLRPALLKMRLAVITRMSRNEIMVDKSGRSRIFGNAATQ